MALAAAPKAIIVPHAGYIYSGRSRRTRIRVSRRPATRSAVSCCSVRASRGGPRLALPSTRAFATPLGEVLVDDEAVALALTLPQVECDDDAHAHEHSLEVQLPFLQRTLEDFRIVPFAVGAATPAMVAEVIELLWGGPETLIVVSSDLSHYQRYAQSARDDRATVDAILALLAGARSRPGVRRDADQWLAERSAPPPIASGAPRSAQLRGYAGDKSRVVGYARSLSAPE
jgi:AmmeMemoRadiSam system protein B